MGSGIVKVKTTGGTDAGEAVDAEPGVTGRAQEGGSGPEVALIVGSGAGRQAEGGAVAPLGHFVTPVSFMK